VEELHVWGLSTSRIALTAHLLIDDDRLQRQGLSRDQLLALARQRLESFDIRKSTLQLETAFEPPQEPGTASPAEPPTWPHLSHPGSEPEGP
jgi:cobalt-zinc-cadmium efflux system protein